MYHRKYEGSLKQVCLSNLIPLYWKVFKNNSLHLCILSNYRDLPGALTCFQWLVLSFCGCFGPASTPLPQSMVSRNIELSWTPISLFVLLFWLRLHSLQLQTSAISLSWYAKYSIILLTFTSLYKIKYKGNVPLMYFEFDLITGAYSKRYLSWWSCDWCLCWPRSSAVWVFNCWSLCWRRFYTWIWLHHGT